MQLIIDALKEAAAWPDAGQRTPVVLASQLMAAGLSQFTADNWGMDALDPQGVAVQSILPEFFGNADQPDALPAIRAWTACLFDSLSEQDKLVDTGALSDLEVPVSISFGGAIASTRSQR